MPKFCVLSQNKVKSLSELRELYAHNARLYTPNNCNPELHNLNEYMLSTRSYNDLLQARLKKDKVKTRKNSVLALEYTSKFSLGSRLDINEWKAANQKFFEDYFGKENVVSMIVHYDEHSPHIHTLVIPVVKKRKKHKNGNEYDQYTLDARHFTGGNAAMMKMQQTYAEYMKPFGLEKGKTIKKEKANYEDINKFYRNITKAANFVLPKKKKDETVDEYIERATPVVREEQMNHLRIVNKLRQDLHEANITLLNNETLLSWAKKHPELSKKIQNLSEEDFARLMDEVTKEHTIM